MQRTASGSLVGRMIGAARLDAGTYEEVEHDPNATTQAAIVVVIASIATGIAAIGRDGLEGFIAGIAFNLIGWAIFAGVVYFVGTRLMADVSTSATPGEVLRTLGFSYAPESLAVLGFLPGVGFVIQTIALAWSLVASVIAVRQALDIRTWLAIGVVLVSFLLVMVVIVIAAIVIGVGIAGFGD
jgi:hypothetical protein